MLFLLYNIIYTFLIQDGYSLKYLKLHDMGLIITVDLPDTATQWEIFQTGDNPIILAIQKQGTDMCLEVIPGANNVQGLPYSEKQSQKFKLNLKPDGFYNIVQDDRLFLHYDITSNEIKADRHVPEAAKGFKFVTDDVSREWPNHVLTQHEWL